MPPRRIIIASNRLPYSRNAEGHWQRSPGGLVSAMQPVLEKRPAIWIGWDGSVSGNARPVEIDGLRLKRVTLSRSELETYYHGFSNSTLWALYHDALQTPAFHRAWWRSYWRTNRKFATAISRSAGRGATVWIHDYHLQLVPMMLRKSRPDLRIGFFLHIPFPPEELFAWLPWRTQILSGLLGADLAAFQTEAGSQNFSRAARRYTEAEGVDRELTLAGRTIKVRPIPISIDVPQFESLSTNPKTIERAAEIRRMLDNRRVLLGVDRLDYTKGILERLRAFEELLRSRKLSVNDVVYIQIAVPSREESLGYQEIRRAVEETVGRINGQFSEPGRVPVHYFRRSLDAKELVAYYLAADVMLVTPLRDGMNLVAKEYVVSRADLDGILVLSEFAGAAWELRRALLVNPRDIDSMRSTILTALRMPRRERRMRMAILRTQVKRHDVHEWAREFLETLAAGD